MFARIIDIWRTLGAIVFGIAIILGIGWLLFQAVNLAFRLVTGSNLL